MSDAAISNMLLETTRSLSIRYHDKNGKLLTDLPGMEVAARWVFFAHKYANNIFINSEGERQAYWNWVQHRIWIMWYSNIVS